MLTCNVGLLSGVGKWALISIRHPHIPRPWNPIRANLQGVASLILSQSSIFGQNPKIGCQEFNDLQTPKLSKKQLCDRTLCGTTLADCTQSFGDILHHSPGGQ